MPQYRRARVAGARVFLTIVTYQRRPLFADTRDVGLLRDAMRQVRHERPLSVEAAVVMPDHLHLLWRLPAGDADYSARVGRLKALVTRQVMRSRGIGAVSDSRRKHRESDVWQRRFWEHTIRDEDDWRQHIDYIHYNPVRHGLARCPHEWPYSSFMRWVKHGGYPANWCCRCGQESVTPPAYDRVGDAGE